MLFLAKEHLNTQQVAFATVTNDDEEHKRRQLRLFKQIATTRALLQRKIKEIMRSVLDFTHTKIVWLHNTWIMLFGTILWSFSPLFEVLNKQPPFTAIVLEKAEGTVPANSPCSQFTSRGRLQ